MRGLVNSDMKIKVERTRLLETLKGNLEIHLSEYEEAMSGFREQVADKLREELKKAEAGDIPKSGFSLALTAPVCYEDAYRTIITMMEFNVEEHVELDAEQSRNYLMDEWDWKRSFKRDHAAYSRAI
jgi:hypothetical protein